VHMTVTTLDERLARRLEPQAPTPAKRLEAVRALARAGIRVVVNAMPIIAEAVRRRDHDRVKQDA